MTWSAVTGDLSVVALHEPLRVGHDPRLRIGRVGNDFRQAGRRWHERLWLPSRDRLGGLFGGLRRTRRARATRELSSIGTGGRPGRTRTLSDRGSAPVELGLMLGDLSAQVRLGLSQPVRTLGIRPLHRLAGLDAAATLRTRPCPAGRSARTRSTA